MGAACLRLETCCMWQHAECDAECAAVVRRKAGSTRLWVQEVGAAGGELALNSGCACRWEANVVPPMPCARVGHAAVALRGRLYALGGFDGFFLLSSVHSMLLPPASATTHPRARIGRGDGPVSTQAEEAEEMPGHHADPWGQPEAEEEAGEGWKGGVWEQEAAMLQPRAGFGACVVGQQIWAAGGNQGFECLASSETFLPDRLVLPRQAVRGLRVPLCRSSRGASLSVRGRTCLHALRALHACMSGCHGAQSARVPCSWTSGRVMCDMLASALAPTSFRAPPHIVSVQGRGASKGGGGWRRRGGRAGLAGQGLLSRLERAW